MRFQLGGQLYSPASIDEVSLRDVLLFDEQCEDLGLTARWSDVERAAIEISLLSLSDAEKHPRRNLVIAAMVWSGRRKAGENLAFGDAVDFPQGELRWIPDPKDRKPGKASGPKKARKATTRAGSGQGAAGARSKPQRSAARTNSATSSASE